MVKLRTEMVQNSSMRLDHISYVTAHEQLADTVQRIGALIGSAFVDGGIHPRFGTRNFTCALKNDQYIEVVCPLDHPATEQTPWGKAVKNKANEGGGWLTWVFSTDDISSIEEKFGRESTEGHRTRPNGTDLKWKQVGVKEISQTPELPFFIQWLTTDHPSQEGVKVASISKIIISKSKINPNPWIEEEIKKSLTDVEIEYENLEENEGQPGIIAVEFKKNKKILRID